MTIYKDLTLEELRTLERDVAETGAAFRKITYLLRGEGDPRSFEAEMRWEVSEREAIQALVRETAGGGPLAVKIEGLGRGETAVVLRKWLVEYDETVVKPLAEEQRKRLEPHD